MSRARPRARRSRYSVSHRLTRSVPALIGAVLLVAIVVTATVAYRRIDDFLSATTGKHLTLGAVVEAVQPDPGSIAYKLQHGQQVNVLLLGMGGYENDAPFLTDSIMAVTIDPNSHRVMLASIPRDLVARMNLQTNANSIWTNKINAAYEVPYTNIICCVAPQYQGRDGGGRAAEHEVGKITGLTFDRYIAIDFVAFRDMVNALGGVDVCLTTNLDDYEYPNYGHGYIALHYRAGCQHLSGEQALQVARSRHAIEPQQSSDFGRAPPTGHHAGDQEEGDNGQRVGEGAAAARRAAEEHPHGHVARRHEGDIRLGQEPSGQRDPPAGAYSTFRRGRGQLPVQRQLRHGSLRVAAVSRGPVVPDDPPVHRLGFHRPVAAGGEGAGAVCQRVVHVQRPGRSGDHDAGPARPAAREPDSARQLGADADPRLLGRPVPQDHGVAGQLLRRPGHRGDACEPAAGARPADVRDRRRARPRLRRPLVHIVLASSATI